MLLLLIVRLALLMFAVSAPIAGNDAGLVLQECNQEALCHAAGESSHCSEECRLK